MTDGFKGIRDRLWVPCSLQGDTAARQEDFVDVVEEEMQVSCLIMENAKDRLRRRQMIRCGDP